MELKTVELTKQYGKKKAVYHMSVTLNAGVYGLLGANGAGKTTLMRLLCALQRPTEGRILLDGKNIEKLGEGYRDLLGYLPQGFGYYPDFRAIDFLRYIAALKGLEGKAGERRAWELLEEVGLSCEARHRIKTFSGGMKQRLGIAQAMLNDPRILILDEPTTGLDPKERVRFRNLISAFSKGRIVILSTHIVSDVEFIAERILVMKSGQIVHCGRPGEIISEIQGQVWECAVPAGHADRYVAELNVSNLRNERDGRTVLRVIAGERPMGNARLVETNLEDLYMYYFREQPAGGRRARGRGLSEDDSGAKECSRDFGSCGEAGDDGKSGNYGDSKDYRPGGRKAYMPGRKPEEAYSADCREDAQCEGGEER